MFILPLMGKAAKCGGQSVDSEASLPRFRSRCCHSQLCDLEQVTPTSSAAPSASPLPSATPPSPSTSSATPPAPPPPYYSLSLSTPTLLPQHPAPCLTPPPPLLPQSPHLLTYSFNHPHPLQLLCRGSCMNEELETHVDRKSVV